MGGHLPELCADLVELVAPCKKLGIGVRLDLKEIDESDLASKTDSNPISNGSYKKLVTSR